MEHDITIPITSMLRMGYYPETLINELNQIKKLSMFKSDPCLRMLDNLLSYKGEEQVPAEIIDKLLNQAVV